MTAETIIHRSTSQPRRRWFWTYSPGQENPDDLFSVGSLGYARSHLGARFAVWRSARHWRKVQA